MSFLKRSPSAQDIFKLLEKNAEKKPRSFSSDAPLHTETGKHAVKCISAFLAHNQTTLIEESAAFLEALFTTWSVHQIPPKQIWAELKRREQLGSVFLNLNSPPALPSKGSLPRKWKTKSTKLP